MILRSAFRGGLVVAVVGGMSVSMGPQSSSLPPTLAAMIDTERTFARAAAVNGVRAAFLEYFADDAVSFGADPGRAKDGILKWKPLPPSILELTWEPRYGDVAASGEWGYLTGPAIRTVHGEPPTGPVHVCYFTVWKKQAGGAYRVFIDLGITIPAAAPFAAGFTRAGALAGFRTGGDGLPSLQQAERAFADAARSAPIVDVYRQFLHSRAWMYRDQVMPLMSSAAALEWLEYQSTKTIATDPLYAESATSADLGFSYGRYALTGAREVERGCYVRVWARDVRGTWHIAFEVTAPAPATEGH